MRKIAKRSRLISSNLAPAEAALLGTSATPRSSTLTMPLISIGSCRTTRPKVIWALKNSFKEKRHKVGGEMVSLNDIESSALRPEFGYRSHAVLVCAARSCPPLQRSAYSGGQLDEQCDHAYRVWLGRKDLNEFLVDKNEANVSSIFKWFKGDFEKAGGVKTILAKYAPAQAKPLLQRPDCKITNKIYNWGLNDQGPHGRNWKQSVFDFF